jgi:hypothetical protein
MKHSAAVRAIKYGIFAVVTISCLCAFTVPGFSPTSITTKTGTKATNKFTFTRSPQTVAFRCISTGVMILSTGTASYATAKDTLYYVGRGKGVTFVAISSATGNSCKYISD